MIKRGLAKASFSSGPELCENYWRNGLTSSVSLYSLAKGKSWISLILTLGFQPQEDIRANPAFLCLWQGKAKAIHTSLQVGGKR